MPRLRVCLLALYKKHKVSWENIAVKCHLAAVSGNRRPAEYAVHHLH